MEAGFDAIVQATLGNEVFSGVADALLRVDTTTSSLPGYAYEPADTKLSLETKPGTILQLCTYAELLQPMQGEAPELSMLSRRSSRKPIAPRSSLLTTGSCVPACGTR